MIIDRKPRVIYSSTNPKGGGFYCGRGICLSTDWIKITDTKLLCNECKRTFTFYPGVADEIIPYRLEPDTKWLII